MFKDPNSEIVFDLMQAQMYISAANRIVQGKSDLDLSIDLLDISIAIAKLSLKIGNND